MTTPREPLLLRVAGGDSTAARECVDRFGRLVWALARKYTHSLADAEDASQEIFEALFKSAHRFDPARSTESGFVAMIARRRLVDGARRRRVRLESADAAQREPQAAGGLDPDERLDAARMAKVLDALPTQERDVLLLTVVEGLSHQQIAVQQEIPLGTVKTYARRGLMRLRAWLGQTDTEASA